MLEPTAASAFEIPADAADANASAVSWGAILAGGVAAAALTLVLIAFGAGVGFSTVSPWSSIGSQTTFHVGAGLYLIVTAMLASSVGGYLAGRLRKKWASAHTREVFFRDTAHGFLAWAFATLLSAGALGSAAGTLVNAGTVATGAAARSTGLLDGYVDALVRGEPGNDDAEAMIDRGIVSRIFVKAFGSGGTLEDSDRTYLVKLVGERTGVSPSQAEARVTTVVDEARQSIDKARKAAAQLALWLTASMFVGAFCASLAAIEGGGLRDGTWKYQV